MKPNDIPVRSRALDIQLALAELERDRFSDLMGSGESSRQYSRKESALARSAEDDLAWAVSQLLERVR